MPKTVKSKSGSSSSSSKEKKWSEIAPKSRKERTDLANKCGKSKCFLSPEDLKFPICDQSCNVSCKGLRAAKSRARQWGYIEVGKKAEAKAKACPRKK